MNSYHITEYNDHSLHVLQDTYLATRVGYTPKKNLNSKIVRVYNLSFESRKSAVEYINESKEFKPYSISKDKWIDVLIPKKLKSSNLIFKYIKLGFYCSWFIKQYFGQELVDKLFTLAFENKESELTSILTDIWFRLPDGKFNIIENPEGWDKFLYIIED